MRHSSSLANILITTALFASCAHAAKTLQFGGYEWTIKQSADEKMGPGPNNWDENNVWLDEQKRLHLKISQRDGQWQCAELFTEKRLGFGRYQWQIVGRPDRLDPQIVLGLFPYTRPDVGPDTTNEIDIEFARWGKRATPIGNFSVWPAMKESDGQKREEQTHAFDFQLDGAHTTARFDWLPQSVEFRLLGGHREDDQNTIEHWKFAPAAAPQSIPQQSLPLHLNFWLFQGQAPQNGQSTEIVISNFTFTPLKK